LGFLQRGHKCCVREGKGQKVEDPVLEFKRGGGMAGKVGQSGEKKGEAFDAHWSAVSFSPLPYLPVGRSRKKKRLSPGCSGKEGTTPSKRAVLPNQEGKKGGGRSSANGGESQR